MFKVIEETPYYGQYGTAGCNSWAVVPASERLDPLDMRTILGNMEEGATFATVDEAIAHIARTTAHIGGDGTRAYVHILDQHMTLAEFRQTEVGRAEVAAHWARLDAWRNR